MFIFKYITSLWTRKITGQLITFLYSIPVILIVLCSVSQMIMPITSNIIFENNSQYNYLYKTNYYAIQQNKVVVSDITQTLLNKEEGTKLLFKEDSLISSGYRENLSTESNPYVKTNSFINLYIAKSEADLTQTIFSKENFISESTPYNTKTTDIPHIYLAYNTAKYLNVKTGDIVINWTTENYIKCVVAGILRPWYDGESKGNTPLEYNQYMSFPSLLVVNDELYEEHLKHDKSLSLVVFSDILLIDLNKAITFSSKEDAFKILKDVVIQEKAVFRFILQFLFSICIICFILIIEFNFIRKKNSKDIEILGMLGMRISKLKFTFAIHLLINYLFTVLLSLIICRYFYFNQLLKMYCEPLVLIWVAFGILISGILIVILRSLFVKRTI